MLKKRFFKRLAIGLTALMMTTVLASCSGGDSSENKIVYNISEEEQTIDPGLNQSLNAGTLIQNSFEGLTRINPETKKPDPAAAEKWEISEDGTVYTFHLRQGMKWSDGQPVTAKDFQFAWTRALSKETASPYSEILMYIKGGHDYFEGKAQVVEGIKVIDDNTLQVTLEAPTAFFLELTSFPTYMPLREDVVKDDSWATKPETYITNGPMVLKEWRPKDIMVYEKNPNYWNQDAVKLDKLEVRMISEPTNALNAFKTGELDYMEKPPAQEVPALLADGTAKQYQNIGTYMYMFNISDKMKEKNPEAYKALSNQKVRKAIALAIDRKAIVETATKGGEVPANSIVPPGIVDANGNDFKSKEYFPVEGNVEEAKKLLAEAGYPNGQGFPEIELLYNVGSGHEQIAQAVQEMLRKNLNINVKLSNQEWKVFLSSMTDQNFDMCRKGWIGDYMDPSTMLKLFKTGASNNQTGFSTPKVDELREKAAVELEEAQRVDLYHQAEAIVMEEMPVVPIYYYTDIVLMNPSIKGLHKSPLGFISFYTAYKEQ